MLFLQRYAKAVVISVSAIIWFSFYEIWGMHNWTRAALFDNGWWIDTTGHLTAGVIGAINLICVYQTFDQKRIFYFAGDGHLVTTITGKMLFFAFLWEVGEMFYDMQIAEMSEQGFYLIRAQINSLDTVIDIGATFGAALFTSLAYVGYNTLREKIYPDEYQKEELREFFRMASYLAEKTARYQKEHRWVIRTWLKKKFKKFKTFQKKRKARV